jgi:hypothetical protein
MNLLSKLNQKYTIQLQTKPLKTKALTLVFFALLNEQLASFFAGDIQKLHVYKNFSIPHTFSSRVPLMGVFALLINTPLTHYGYKIIQKLVPSPLTPRKKLLQIILSTGVVTPIFCACFVSWIGLINNMKKLKLEIKNGSKLNEKLSNLIKLFLSVIKTSLKSSFLKVCSTSVITSPIFMLLAQKFVIPEAWTVFFAFCYFIVGTYNNTKVKLIQKRLREQKQQQDQQDKDE